MEKFLGKHILAEFWDCDVDFLSDKEKIENAMLEAAKCAQVTIVEKCFHTFSPYGVSGVVVIAESHLAIHTWPEYKYAAVDFFTCSHNCNTDRAIEYLKQEFKAGTISAQMLKRGELQ